MPLTNKYLKYSPEITLEIFTLVWDKLISCGWKPYSNQEIQTVWTYLTKNSWYGIKDSGGSKFIQYRNTPLVVFTETTVQEILGYDPFIKEEVIPEYVEYIKSDDVDKIAKVLEWSAASYCRIEFPNGTIKEPFKHLVKPSTKEAFDAQNQPKQLLKQAVHCKTQKEWDFANDIHQSSLKADFKDYKDKTVLILDFKNAYADILWAKTNDYQILSFQEWCDLNGYKMESNQEFKVGNWVVNLNASMNYKINEICKISLIEDGKIACEGKPTSKSNQKDFKYFRHATPEEINNHLISIGQIPAGEPLNTGIEPNKDGAFKYTTLSGSSWSGGTIQNHLETIIPTTGNCYNKDFATSYIPIKSKMILSIDDEELPMVNIMTTNTIKQLLNSE